MGLVLSDPIGASLARLDDPDLWVIEVGVPVFCPHVRRGPDGNVLYEVTDSDIPVIASESAKLEAKGTIPRQTIGHVNLAPDADESKQPPLIGFERNFRVGTWQGRPAVVCDVYTRRDKWEQAENFPYRSAEYRPKSKQIRGVARLLRDPWLDLGTLVYDSADGPVYFYAMGSPMPDDKKPDEAPPTPAPAATDETPEMTPEEQKVADKVYRYFLSANKWMSHCAQKYQNGEPAAAGPAFPGGNNTTVPTEKKKDEETVPNQSPEQTVQYAAIEERCKKLEAQNATLIADREGEKVDRLLDQLEKVELYQFDREDERKAMLAMDTAGRAKRADSIRKFHHRLPGGEMIQTYQGHAEGGKAPDTTEGQMRAAVSYATKHGCDYDTAIAAVKAGKS